MKLDKIKTVLKNISLAFRILFQASGKYFFLYWGFSIISAMVYFLPIYVWKELLNLLADNSNGMTVVTVIVYVLIYTVVLILEKMLNNFRQIVSYKYNDAIDYYIDNKLIDSISQTRYSFFDAVETKDAFYNVTGMAAGVTKEIPNAAFGFIEMFIWSMVSIVIMFRLSPLVPILLSLVAVPDIIIKSVSSHRDYEFQKRHVIYERRKGYYQNLFGGNTLLEIKLYDLKDHFIEIYESVSDTLRKDTRKKDISNTLLKIIPMAILMLSNAAIYVFIISKLIIREIGIGDVTYYVSITTQFRTRFSLMCESVVDLIELSERYNDIRGFFDKNIDEEKGGDEKRPERPVVEFRNVTFRYPGSDVNVLKNCSFTINFGEKVGLVGLNGSGKSTVAKLLCRLYDPTEGIILINGIDEKEYDIRQLRSIFGVMFQDYNKYSFSLRENIALSDINRIDNDAELIDAAKQSRVWDFADEWEKGLEENLTKQFDPDGRELSGGQWQRISIARAFFRNAPIVLLDEPSAALDAIAEHEIFTDFYNVSDNKSALLISHRLSNITGCDRILVLESGRIIEQGSHKELMSEEGRYAYLFNLQASKYQLQTE